MKVRTGGFLLAIGLGLVATCIGSGAVRAGESPNPTADIGPTINPNQTPAGGSPYSYCAGQVMGLSPPGSCNPSLDLGLDGLLANIPAPHGGVVIPIGDLPVPGPKRKNK